jgi:flagellar P-ring protein precursor FlgI
MTALAQGSLTVGGYSAGVGGPGGDVQVKNHTTVGRVPGGATVGRDRPMDFLQGGRIRYLLRHPDFTTAVRMVNAINEKFVGAAIAVDAATMTVRVPDALVDSGQVARFISGLETIRVVPDIQSKIIVNERTGTIVMGGDVRISDAIVAHGNLTVNVGSTLSTYMPNAFTEARPVTTEKVLTQTQEDEAKVMLLPATSTVRDLADLLNQLGTTPRDLISVLDALQKLGAIQMELVTM